jgi:hypothetical protein
MTWRPWDGALGIEFGFCGFGWGSDLFHRYLKLGIVTLYLSEQRLEAMLKMWRRARDVLRGPP